MAYIVDEMDIYYETLNERPDLGWFLQGHMVVEFMLRKRLSERNPELAHQLRKASFFSVLKAALNNDIVSQSAYDVLSQINIIRNKYAHELNYRPTLEEWIDLWSSAQNAFSDMTDGIEQGLAELESVQRLEDADRFSLNELFVQICHDI